ncbi:hypothetical protein [Alteribacter populi]|uniref:hypothetical protein n=1 Tax=Alteribacter populi TaxID=2011011 RepID=UPI000BBAFCF7|nr:hypothetical protein [Alteribacter populi]
MVELGSSKWLDQLTATPKRNISLRAGQLIQGKIKQLYPGQVAQLNYGGTNLAAKLEVPLERDRHYWFRVVSSEGMPLLKVLDNTQPLHTATDGGKEGARVLAQSLNMPLGGTEERMIRFFSEQKLPFSNQELVDSVRLAQASSLSEQKAFQLLSVMIERGLPLTRETFLSVASLQSAESLAILIDSLAKNIEGDGRFARLYNLLTSMMQGGGAKEKAGGNTPFPPQLTAFLQQLGLDYESQLKRHVVDERPLETRSLKQELLHFLSSQNVSGELKDSANAIIYRITGTQLLATEQHPYLHQQIVHLPYKNHSLLQDVTVQWEGRKKRNGDWDSDFCRILFYLDLEALKSTVVDVHIQNRVVSLTVYNENAMSEQAINSLRPHLENELFRLDYQLSSVNWKQPETVKEMISQSKSAYELGSAPSGVDIRI